MEEAVLHGLDDDLWERVQQVIIEVHDVGSRIADMRGLLTSKGFLVKQSVLSPPCFLLGEGTVYPEFNTSLLSGSKV